MAGAVYVHLCVLSLVYIVRSQLCSENAGDPCENHNNQMLRNQDTRHPSIPFSDITNYNSSEHCDLYAMNPGTWYRSKYNMTSACVGFEVCGTSKPIWMNGTIPAPDDGIVDRVGCLRTFDSCCERSYNFRVKNCYHYTVYCLLDMPSSCPQRYCFDIDTSNITTTKTTMTTTTTLTARSQVTSTSCKEPDVYLTIITLMFALLVTTVGFMGFLLYRAKRAKHVTIADPSQKTYPDLHSNLKAKGGLEHLGDYISRDKNGSYPAMNRNSFW